VFAASVVEHRCAYDPHAADKESVQHAARRRSAGESEGPLESQSRYLAGAQTGALAGWKRVFERSPQPFHEARPGPSPADAWAQRLGIVPHIARIVFIELAAAHVLGEQALSMS